MPVTIDAIQFNHQANSITNDAINIRKNFSTPARFPEWQKVVCNLPEDSLAAYCIKETQGNDLTIKASFSMHHMKDSHLQIRAIDPNKNPPGGSGCIAFIVRFLYILFNAISGNVLGEVKKRNVPVVNGSTGFLSFKLKHTLIGKTGVGVHTTVWRWQYKHNGGPWHDIATTQHRIYVLLEAPKSPWNLTADSPQNPWTDVLDYSCNWAMLTHTRDDAASKITDNVFALGPSILIYDCPGGGGTHYTDYSTTFYCTQFVDRLKGGLGNGQYLNCTDCATITCSFSNIIGCDLWASKMGYGFNLNAINAIGYNNWISCGWGGFSYHEVAWKDNCTEADAIFDACLQVDGDADPSTAPHTPLLPENMVFGTCVSNEYRWRLSPPNAGGCQNCAPQPTTRIRRIIA